MAAIAAAGVATSMAQVYSVNAVGYVSLSLKKGFNMITNPLNNGSNKLTEILPDGPVGAEIYTFTNGKFDADIPTFIEGLGWFPDTATLKPGQGAFIRLTADAAPIFVGEVPQGDVSMPLNAGFNLIASVVPIEAALDSTGNAGMNFPGQAGDEYYGFENGVGYKSEIPTIIEGLGWFPSAPTPKVGEAFFLRTGTARTWTRSFSVN
ncbi:MAG: hypothetical protein HYY24_16465 [Verrucomicrobia bacterium]|nr:hypothetical protein [Verrucomicrobiota bacterium]